MLARFLLGEQTLRIPGQLDEANAFFQIGLVSGLVPTDLPQAAILLCPPFIRHTLEKHPVDSPVELVHIHGVKTLLEAVILGLKPGNGSLVLLLLIGMTLAECGADPLQDLVAEMQLAEHGGESLGDNLLADIGFPTFPLVMAAIIIDVAALLDLATIAQPQWPQLIRPEKAKSCLLRRVAREFRPSRTP